MGNCTTSFWKDTFLNSLTATISFANYKPQNKNIPKQNIPSAEKICKLKNLDSIPVPTATIDVRNNCNYDNIASKYSKEINIFLLHIAFEVKYNSTFAYNFIH